MIFRILNKIFGNSRLFQILLRDYLDYRLKSRAFCNVTGNDQ